MEFKKSSYFDYELEYFYTVDDFDIRFYAKNRKYVCELNTYPNEPDEFLKRIKKMCLEDNNKISFVFEKDENKDDVFKYISHMHYY